MAAETLVGYGGSPASHEDREVESLIGQGVAVITPALVDHQQSKSSQYTLIDVSKTSPSSSAEHRVDDDDDSDHASSDPYQQHMKGRVSPSPYTANTERARQFNTYVRSAIEERLDTLIPISHQPRDLVQQIIADAGSKFPEFATSVRKRIRTYLKSYRRSKRVKDMQAAAAMAHQYSPVPSSNGVIQKSESTPHINIASISLPNELTVAGISTPSAAVVTIGNHDSGREEECPIPKKPRLISSSPIQPQQKLTTNVTNSIGSFTSNEVSSLQQLIQGYRESAMFLNRAADQLEEMLHKDNPHLVL